MNRSRARMEEELRKLGVDPARALHIAESKGTTFDATTDEEWRLDAITLAEGFTPEQIAEPFKLSPAERLAVFEGLTRIDRRRASAYREKHAEAIALASEGRALARHAVAELRVGHEQVAHDAERRLREIGPMLDRDKAHLLRLNSQPSTPSVEANRATLMERVVTLQTEAEALQDTIKRHRDRALELAATRIR